MKLFSFVPIVLAFFASLCCVVPLPLALLGITSVGLATLTQYHDWFVVGAVASLILFIGSFAYRIYKRKISKWDVLLIPLILSLTFYFLILGQLH